MAPPQKLKRSPLSGAVLRPLGFSSWGAERTETGISFHGGARTQVPFSEWAGPPKLTSTLGFSTMALPLADGTEIKLAGIKSSDAIRFISAASEAFREHITRQFKETEEELKSLAQAIGRLEQPRRYLAACLLSPFLERATKAIDSLPALIPDGVLADSDQRLLDVVRTFKDAPEQARKAAIQRFIETELADMKAFLTPSSQTPCVA